MKNLIIVLILFSAVNFSCSNNTSNNEAQVNLPLKIGNSWTYSVERINFRDSLVTTVQEADIKFTVKSDTMVEGIQWFFIESDKRRFNSARTGYYSNQDDGIYFVSSFEAVDLEAINAKDFDTGNMLLGNEIASSDDVNKYLFLHNPDNKVPERIIKNNRNISSISYRGKTKNGDFNTISHNYVWNYYQANGGTRTYAIKPFDIEFSVSNDVGLLVFELGYVATNTVTEEDSRLKLTALYRCELKEFSKN